MHGLIEARLARIGQGGRRQKADRAGQHRGLVRQDVAEQVVGDDHVELLGVLHQLHGGVVGQHVLQLDVGVFALVQIGHDLAPEEAGVHHIGLLGRGHLVAAAPRQLEGDPRHPLDLALGVDLQVIPALLAGRGVRIDALVAEIDPRGQLAHDHDVEAGDDLALQGRGVGQGFEADRRTQVGEGVHRLAQVQEARFRTLVARIVGPLRPADRAHQDGGGVQRQLLGLFGQRRVMQVVAGPAEGALIDVELQARVLAHPGRHAAHLGDHLGADAVAGQEQQGGAVGQGHELLLIQRRHPRACPEDP